MRIVKCAQVQVRMSKLSDDGKGESGLSKFLVCEMDVVSV